MGLSWGRSNGELYKVENEETLRRDSTNSAILETDMNSLELRKVKTNNCNCDICMGVRVSLLNYKNHEPKDNLELMFKNAIDKACEKGKLYI